MTRRDDQYAALSPDDRRLLDALVESGFDREGLELLSASDGRRVEALMSLFELLEDYPVEDADETLVHATLARIDRYEAEAAARLAFDPVREEAESNGGARRWRIPDFISVAAVILIASGVIWPTTSYLRQRRIDTGCGNNLRMMGVAFTNYSSDYGGRMPIAHAGIFNGWSSQANNSVNLNPIVEGGYCQIGHLDCPGNHDLDPSYSYQWQQVGVRMMWEGRRVIVVLGDRNPVIDAARQGAVASPLTVSLNHGGRGQNVLWSDGADIWLERPVIGSNDNIWVPMGVWFLRAGDHPQDPADVFLAH